MKKFFFSHPDIILAVIAFVLLGILIGFFSWGINDVVTEVHGSIVSSAAPSQSDFNIQGAENLNYRGLSTSTVVSATMPTSPATSTSSSTASSSL